MKVQRISSLFRTSDHPMNVFDCRVSAVTTKQELDVRVAVGDARAAGDCDLHSLGEDKKV